MKPRACQRAACVRCRRDLVDLRTDKADWRDERVTLNDTIERLTVERRAAHNAALIAQADIAKLTRRLKRLKKREAL